MKKKTSASGGRREELVRAALELFLARGYEETSVRDILAAVHGEVGMFYHYFKSKDEIFDAAMDRCLADCAERLDAPCREDISAGAGLLELLNRVDEVLPPLSGELPRGVRLALRQRMLPKLLSAGEALVCRALEEGGALPENISSSRAAEFLLGGLAALEQPAAEEADALVERLLGLRRQEPLSHAGTRSTRKESGLPSWLL